MDEATTRHRAPSPSNTRKFVEADARSTDLLPKSSTSHARGPSTNFPQVRDEPEFILHDLAGPYPVQNSPSTPGSAAHPVQNSPSKRPWQAHPVQNSPSEPQNADFGPFFACRENFVPLPPPTTRAGRTLSRMRGRFRYKTLPASPKTPISAHFSHAGRTLYRFRHQQPEQGELYPACGAASGTKLSQQAPKRRFRPTFRMQGELCTASATNTTSREKKVTHQHPTAPTNAPLPKFRMQFD